MGESTSSSIPSITDLLESMEDQELIRLRAGLDVEMKRRKIALSVGQMAENLAIQFFTAPRPRFTVEKQRGLEIAKAFFTASRTGNMAALGAMLAADVSLHADGGGKRTASPQPLLGLEPVIALHRTLATLFRDGGSILVRTAMISGLPGILTREGDGELQTTAFDINDEGTIAAIYVMRNPDKLVHLH